MHNNCQAYPYLQMSCRGAQSVTHGQGVPQMQRRVVQRPLDSVQADTRNLVGDGYQRQRVAYLARDGGILAPSHDPCHLISFNHPHSRVRPFRLGQ